MALTDRFLGAWREDHAWASIYDFIVERERLGGALWRLGMNTDLRLLYEAAAETGSLPPGSAVLDIPCGGGVALRGIRVGQDVRYVAADISPAMLERTRRRADELGVADLVALREADVEALPFADGEFDRCVSFTGLHCFPRPAVAVGEMARVLRGGGTLVGSMFVNGGLRYAPMRVLGRRTGLLGPSGTTEELRGWLDDAGFSDVALKSSGPMTYFQATAP